MLLAEESYSLPELCERAGVTTRTVRYYIQQGLLPSPGPGRKARYGRRHLLLLQAIDALKRDHLPLAEIRRRLDGLSSPALEALATGGSPAPAGSAAEYARALLGGAPAGSPRKRRAPPPPAVAPPDRSTWERFSLSPDVELHVRRPLSRAQRRRVERLLDAARTLLRE